MRKWAFNLVSIMICEEFLLLLNEEEMECGLKFCPKVILSRTQRGSGDLKFKVNNAMNCLSSGSTLPIRNGINSCCQLLQQGTKDGATGTDTIIAIVTIQTNTSHFGISSNKRTLLSPHHHKNKSRGPSTSGQGQ